MSTWSGSCPATSKSNCVLSIIVHTCTQALPWHSEIGKYFTCHTLHTQEVMSSSLGAAVLGGDRIITDATLMWPAIHGIQSRNEDNVCTQLFHLRNIAEWNETSKRLQWNKSSKTLSKFWGSQRFQLPVRIRAHCTLS